MLYLEDRTGEFKFNESNGRGSLLWDQRQQKGDNSENTLHIHGVG